MSRVSDMGYRSTLIPTWVVGFLSWVSFSGGHAGSRGARELRKVVYGSFLLYVWFVR